MLGFFYFRVQDVRYVVECMYFQWLAGVPVQVLYLPSCLSLECSIVYTGSEKQVTYCMDDRNMHDVIDSQVQGTS